MNPVKVFLISAVLAVGGAQAADASKYFVLIYSRGPAWKADLPMKDQGLGPHVRYMKELRDGNILFAAGPLDSDGGMIIAKASDREAATAVMEHDPAIQAGLFVGQIHNWAAAFEAGVSPSAFLAQSKAE